MLSSTLCSGRRPMAVAFHSLGLPTLVLIGLWFTAVAAFAHDPALRKADSVPQSGFLGGAVSVPTDVTGELRILHEDYPDYTSRTRHILRTSQGNLELRFEQDAPNLKAGAKLRVTGKRNGDVLRVDSVTASDADTLKSAAVPNTLGEQRTLVILVNFQDKPTEQPWTLDQVRSLVFGTVSDYFRENSYQNTWLAGDVMGWFTIPIDSTYMIQLDGGGAICDQLGIANYAKQAATAAGADLAAYTRYVYMFPTSSCQWSGTATVGGMPSESWINGYLELDVVGHELGHNLGLEHSHSLACSGASIGSGCTYVEYGDGVDIMGWSPSGHFHAFQKERLGWLNNGTFTPPITTVSASGDYAIAPYETPGTTPRALKVLKSVDPTTGARTWYYIEYRQGIGFDGILASTDSSNMMDTSNIVNGVVIHTGYEDNGGADNYLLDMTPQTYDLYTRDPALDVGSTFSDTAAGVTISALWANGTDAGVRITLAQASCVRAKPAVTISPASQSGQAGSSLNYGVTVTNNDTSDCGSSSFNLQGNGPAGWVASIAAATVVLSPGTSAATTLAVTSPSTAAVASYTIGATATNGTATTYTATGTGTYMVAPSLATTVSTDKSSYRKGAQVAITATVTSSGSPLTGVTVSFAVTKPNGSTATQTATTNTSGMAVFNLRLNKQKDPVGTYQVRATASSNGASASGTTSFTVQ